MIRLTDRWLAPPRGDVETVLAFAERVGSLRPTEVVAYVNELWRLCVKYGVDFALAIAHSANETGDPTTGGGWLSAPWRDWLNPIGLGITDTVLDIIVYRSGVEAARAHFVHLWHYITGDFPEGDDELAGYVRLDPRWEAARKKGYAGIALTLGDLQGRWWTKQDGDKAVVERGNAIFPDLPNQTKGGGSVAERIVFGRVPKPDNIVDAFVDKPAGHGWDNQGPRDRLLAIILHAIKGYAWTTGGYFGNPKEPHGYNALTDWGICGEIDARLFGADKDGLIMDWNDPDGRGYYRRPWASGGDGSKAVSGDAVRWVNRYGIAAINTYGEAIELSLLQNNDPVSARMLQSAINLIAWRVDSKGHIPYHRWPLNNDGVHMLLSHYELGKSSCHIPDAVFVAVINGVRDRLKQYQVVTGAAPVEPASQPEPKHQLPVWLPEKLAKRLYGRYRGVWGTTYEFDLTKAPSQDWLARVKRSVTELAKTADAATRSLIERNDPKVIELASTPTLIEVIRRGSPAGSDGELFRWADGSSYWRKDRT